MTDEEASSIYDQLIENQIIVDDGHNFYVFPLTAYSAKFHKASTLYREKARYKHFLVKIYQYILHNQVFKNGKS